MAPSQVQIPSDSTAPTTQTHVGGAATPGGETHTHTYTLPKLTPSGTAGSATFVNGKVTSWTPAT